MLEDWQRTVSYLTRNIRVQKLGVNAASLSSSTSKEEKSRVMKEMSDRSHFLSINFDSKMIVHYIFFVHLSF